MGHTLYGTAPDYIRFLRAYLNRGQLDGNLILSEKTATWVLEDQMRGLAFQRLASSSPLTADFNPFPGVPLTHSFGFLRNEADVPGMRSAGSQSWAGVLHSHYWLDPKKNIAAVFMTQSFPFVEPRFMKAYAEFEKAVYA
jgi:methyl acetate hydrolase